MKITISKHKYEIIGEQEISNEPIYVVTQTYIFNISLANQQVLTILLSFSNVTY